MGTLQIDVPNDTLWRRQVAVWLGKFPITPFLFGAVGDGVTDDTAAILRTIAAAIASHVPIYFPPGNYKVSDTLLIGAANVYIFAPGPSLTTVTTTATDKPIFKFFASGPGFQYGGLCGMALRGPGGTSVAGSSGVTIDNTDDIRIATLDIRNLYNGVEMVSDNQAARIVAVDVADVVNDCFYIEGGNNQYLMNCTTFQTGAPGGAAYHIHEGAGVWLDNSVASVSTNGLLCDPATGKRVVDLFVSNTDFDNSQGDGAVFDTSGGGQIDNCKFVSNRFSFGAGSGVSVSGANITQLQFQACEISKNVEHGAIVNMTAHGGGSDGRLHFDDCLVTGNNSLDSGAFDNYNLTGVGSTSIIGGEIGPYTFDSFTHAKYGVHLTATFTGSVIIDGVTFLTHATAPYKNDNTGSNIPVFGENLGFKTKRQGQAIIPSGSSSVTFTHDFDVTPTSIVVTSSDSANPVLSAIVSGNDFIIAVSAVTGADLGVSFMASSGYPFS